MKPGDKIQCAKVGHVAKVISTGQMLFSSLINDPQEDAHGWYNLADGSHRDCMFLMDNKQFYRMLRAGEIEFIKSEKSQLQLL